MKDYKTLIEDTEFLLKKKKEELVAAQKNHQAIRQAQDEMKSLVETLRQDLEQKESEFRSGIDSANNAKAAIRLAEEERRSLESDLQALEREAKISELQAKQKPFWRALEDRMAHQIEILDDGLEGMTVKQDAAEVCVKMKRLADGMNFSVEATAIRNIQSVYQQTILKLCEMSVDGKQLLPEHKQERLNVLDRFLMSQKIAPLWSA